MAKKAKKKPIKLPKRVSGVKVPMEGRRSVNRLLKSLPKQAAKPLLDAAIGALVTSLAAALEEPLRKRTEAQTAKVGGGRKSKDKGKQPAAH